MPRRSALLLLLAVRVFGAGSFAAHPIALFFKGDNSAPASVVLAMKNELARSVAPAGLDLLWPDNGSRDGIAFPKVVVVTLIGDCRAESTPVSVTSNRFVESLGATHIADGRILPFVDIHCDAIRALLYPRDKMTPLPSPQLMGQSVGRVVAHELYHVLLRTTGHEPAGLASQMFRRDDLICHNLAFGARVERRLQELASSWAILE